MAKQARMDDVSFFEKHVEKGVLTLCVALLFFSVWYWGLSSPRRVPMHRPGAPAVKINVPPEQADATLKKEAERLKGVHEDEKATLTSLPKLQPELDALRAKPFQGGGMIAWGQARKALLPERIEGPGDGEGFGMKVRIAQFQKALPAPAAPVATVSAEVADNGAQPFEGFAAHPVSTYAMTEVAKTWQDMLKYLSLKENPITIVGVEIEVQVADNVDADWATVATRSLAGHRIKLANVADGVVGNQVAELPKLPPTTDDDGIEAVLADVQVIRENMEEILQPRYYSVLDAMGLAWVSWYKNLPREPVEKAGGEITEKIRVLQAAPAGGGAVRPPAGRGVRGRRPPAGRNIDGPMQDGGPRRGAPSRGAIPRRGAPTREIPTRGAVRPTGRPVGPVAPREGDQAEPGDGVNIVEREIAPPLFGQQQQAGKFLIWFHDMTVQAGKAYRYRIRLKILNPLLGNDHLMHKDYKAEAWITTMHTPWSDFSAPVRAVRQVDFFLVDSKRNAIVGPRSKTGKVKVAVFARRLGQLVRHDFTVTKGQPIGSPEDVELRKPPVSQHTPPPEAGAVASEETHSVRKVNFSTDAVVINIDFLKRIFPAGQKRNTTEVVFIDGAGRLRWRLWMRNLPKESQEIKRYNRLNAEIASTAPEEVADTDENARQ